MNGIVLAVAHLHDKVKYLWENKTKNGKISLFVFHFIFFVSPSLHKPEKALLENNLFEDNESR
jgi:hypothetical protein